MLSYPRYKSQGLTDSMLNTNLVNKRRQEGLRKDDYIVFAHGCSANFEEMNRARWEKITHTSSEHHPGALQTVDGADKAECQPTFQRKQNSRPGGGKKKKHVLSRDRTRMSRNPG